MPDSPKRKLSPPYKTPINTWYTRALFDDIQRMVRQDERVDVEPVFTLMHDRPGLINCRKTFVEIGDPTGYQWSMQYLKDYDHWLHLMKNSFWFREAVEDWLVELKAKLKAEGIQAIRKQARDSDNPSLAQAAAKYLANEEWDKKEKGRPTNAQIQAAVKQQTRKRTEEDDDLERIGLKVVK